MYVKHLVVAVALFCFCALCAGAYEFQPLGFESIGMGGAGVASAGGPMAGYYNPALLAVAQHPFEFNLGVGASVYDKDLAANADKLSKYDILDLLSRLATNHDNPGANSASDIANTLDILNILANLESGHNSLSVTPIGSIGVQMKKLGVGLFATGDACAQAIIDPNYLGLTVNANGTYYSYNPATNSYSAGTTDPTAYNNSSLEYALNHGKTYMHGSGIMLLEAPVSFAQQVKIPTGTLSIGASAKAMQAYLYNSDFKIDTSSGDIQNRLNDAKSDGNTFGFDAGLLYQPSKMKNLRFGVVGKDLNSPKITTPTIEYQIDPMYRAGICYCALNNKLDLAVDYDLSKNKTSAGIDSQYLGGGINYHPKSWFSMRAGLMNNMADSSSGIIYTGGFGIGLKQLQIDLSAQASAKSGTYDEKTIPRYLQLNFALVSRW